MFQNRIDALFPPLAARLRGMLAVDDLHSIYWEESGNPDGVPLVFLHGGPGGPLGPIARQFYDPAFYRIVYMHQRGAGESLPLGETRKNTTQLLISDLEALRVLRGIERWVVAGGSWGRRWGSPMRRNIPNPVLPCLSTAFFSAGSEISTGSGARDFFPEAWEAFLGFLPPQRGRLSMSSR